MEEESFIYIYDTVKKIQQEIKQGKSETEVGILYTDFKDKYPTTWKSILSGEFSLIEFKKMSNIYQNVKNKKEGDKLNKDYLGNIAVGNYLAEKYLYPTAGRPSSQNLNKSYSHGLNKTELLKQTIKDMNTSS